jgi:hypothetical protein
MSIQTSPHSRGFSRFLRRILRTPLRLQTYRNLLYLVVMFPLGVGYFVLMTVGFSTGIPLLVVLVGVPIIILLLVVVVELTRLERFLVRVLLGVDIPTPTDETEDSLWTRTKRLVTDLRTWKAVAYLLSEYVYGSVVVWLLGSLGATAGSFLFAPLYYTSAPVVAYGTIPPTEFTLDILFGWNNLLVGLTTTVQLGSWQIETLLGALLVAGLGFILLLLSFQLVNALAWVWGRYARVMLTAPRY